METPDPDNTIPAVGAPPDLTADEGDEDGLPDRLETLSLEERTTLLEERVEQIMAELGL